jgi:uncharacterized membrane protein
VTGVVMWLTTWSLGTRWILSGLFLYVVVAIVAIAFVSPNLKRRIRLLDAGSQNVDEVNRLASRFRTVGIFITVLVLAIVFVMVFKPAF